MPDALPFDFSDPDLLPAALDISLTGFILFRPVYDPANPATITDLAYEYLNPAAQRMLQRPERPAETFLTLYPNALDAGIFAFYRDTFLAGEPAQYDVNYQHDGLDNYFRLAARRAGALLVVSFSDTADQPRTAVEEALRQSQVREQQARADAEAQRRRLHDVLMALPAQVATNRGPDLVYELVNPRYQQLFPTRRVQGLPIGEALPELAGQGILERLHHVYQSGEPYADPEQETWVDLTGTGQLEQRYFSVLFQALRDGEGRVDGLLNFAYDVTEQVLARRQVQQLNQELEARVQQRTQEAEAAARRLQRLTDSLPATTFTVDEHGQIGYVSPQYYAYTGLPPHVPMGQDQPRPLGPLSNGWPALIHPDDVATIAREYGAALARGTAWRYEFRLRGADGRYRWFASQGVPEPLDEARAAGRSRQWFGSNLDVHELKQAQHEVMARDRRLNEILRQHPAMLATLEGPEHRYTFTNPGYDALVDQRARLGATVAECLPEVVDQGFIDLLDGVYRTGQTYEGRETRVVFTPSAGERAEYYVDFTYQALRDAEGRSIGVLVFIVDATERVRARRQAEAAQAELLAAAEQAAAQREAFYQVYAQTPALVALLRAPDHRFDFVNLAYQALFPGRQLVGRTMAEAVPEIQEQGFVALLDGVFQTGETYFGADVPFARVLPDGLPARVAYYNFTYQAYREHGAIAGISIFAFDVTDQVWARQERETHRQRLHDLFLQAPAAIGILAGPELVYELVNPSYQAMFPGRELAGRPLADVFPELAGTGVVETFGQVLQTGASNEEKGLLIPFTNPATGQLEDRYFNYIQQARRDAEGRPDGVMVFAFEVTEQVRARQQAQALADELALTNRQLVRTNVDLDTFVYTASHDLKAPIANLDGLLTLLGDELPPAVAQDPYVAPTLAHMRQAVERFQRTIEQLTDVAKLQKEHAPDGQAVDLAAVVEDVCQDLAPLLCDTQAQLTVAVANHPAIFFAEKNLRSVVYNLLSNALKYRHPDRRPHVDVQAHVRAGHTVLEVHDNGLGLEAGQRARLFNLFQRFHPHVEGTGIGLFMVKRMVENAGGHIEVYSQPGAGTTFFVYLPHAPGGPAA